MDENPTDPREAEKRAAAAAGARLVEPGMLIGLGSGSTVRRLIEALGARIADGLAVAAMAASRSSERAAEAAGIRLIDAGDPFGAPPRLDLALDGADEIDPAFRMIKGGGAALVRERIVAQAAAELVVLADASKRVERLGQFPLPVEILPFAAASTRRLVAERLADVLGRKIPTSVRAGPDGPRLTDNGNLVIDCACGPIADPERLAAALWSAPGVVDHGLFITEAGRLVIGAPDGSATIADRPGGKPGIAA